MRGCPPPPPSSSLALFFFPPCPLPRSLLPSKKLPTTPLRDSGLYTHCSRQRTKLLLGKSKDVCAWCFCSPSSLLSVPRSLSRFPPMDRLDSISRDSHYQQPAKADHRHPSLLLTSFAGVGTTTSHVSAGDQPQHVPNIQIQQPPVQSAASRRAWRSSSCVVSPR